MKIIMTEDEVRDAIFEWIKETMPHAGIERCEVSIEFNLNDLSELAEVTVPGQDNWSTTE